MFGFFEPLRCPRCGGVLTKTCYAFPYPQLRCVSCIRRNNEMKEQVAAEVKKQLASLNNA
jgi:hypothetical protein